MNEDPQLQRWLSAHRDATVRRPSSDHVDVDTLARHAAGQLSATKARAVTEHLLACDDGRCVAFVRSQAEDLHGTEEQLYPAQTGEDAPGRARTFQCRQQLWETFEELARQEQSPMDELIETAMLAYAQARGQLDMPTDPRRSKPSMESVAAARAASFEDMPLPDNDETMDSVDAMRSKLPSTSPRRGPPAEAARARTLASPGAAPPPPQRTHPKTLQSEVKLPAGTQRMAPAPMPAPPAAAMRSPASPPGAIARPPAFARTLGPPPEEPLPEIPAPPPRRSRPGEAPPARPPGRPPAGAAADPMALARRTTRGLGDMPAAPAPPPAQMRSQGLPPGIELPPATVRMQEMEETAARMKPNTLTLVYQGRSYIVEKDRFLLGRSKSQADLRLDDANVSRQHAMIEHVNGAYYIVDLGSTNGVWVQGERVARRPLRDGDVLEITTHKIQVRLG
jgi:hypothetical protein